MSEKWRSIASDIAGTAGFAMLMTGLWLWTPIVSLSVGGALLIVGAVLFTRNNADKGRR